MTARNPEFNLILITSWMQFLLIKVSPKYLKYFTFPKDLLKRTKNKGKIMFRVRFEVLSVTLMKIPVVRDVRSYRRVNSYRRFERLYYLRFHGSSKTWVTTIRQGLTTQKSLFYNYLYIPLCHSVGTPRLLSVTLCVSGTIKSLNSNCT